MIDEAMVKNTPVPGGGGGTTIIYFNQSEITFQPNDSISYGGNSSPVKFKNFRTNEFNIIYDNATHRFLLSGTNTSHPEYGINVSGDRLPKLNNGNINVIDVLLNGQRIPKRFIQITNNTINITGSFSYDDGQGNNITEFFYQKEMMAISTRKYFTVIYESVGA